MLPPEKWRLKSVANMGCGSIFLCCIMLAISILALYGKRENCSMNQQPENRRIVISRNICHGQPRVAGTRVMVHQVLDLLAAGKTVSMITSEDYFPDLKTEDILACVAYASQVIREEDVVPVVV